MPWLKKAGEMPRNDKIWELSDPMYRLYDASLHYCAENLTDGHVPASRITALTPKPATKPQVEALVVRKLWHRLPHLTCKSCLRLRAQHHAGELPKSGYLVHDFLEFNPSKAEWEKRQAGYSAGGKKGSSVRWPDDSGDNSGPESGHDLTDNSSHEGPRSGPDESGHNSSHDPSRSEVDDSSDDPYSVLRTPSSGSIDPVIPGTEGDGSQKRSGRGRRGELRAAGMIAAEIVAAARGGG